MSQQKFNQFYEQILEEENKARAEIEKENRNR